ncbi:MAG: type II secretion system protein [Phycisphaerae bacterium]|jgi:prepilin-type N-terminal cleavage/methylation domain-containing protein
MERNKMKKKGFTLVELLVVIAIIAMLLAILMPALGKVRQLAQRLMCGTNIAGIGKAMLVYSNDDRYGSYPAAGGPGAQWDEGSGGEKGVCTWNWCDKDATPGYTTGGVGVATTTTLSAHLYLLVKFADVSPDQFICPGSDLKKFELSNYNYLPAPPVLPSGVMDVWDFGTKLAHKSQPSGHGRGHCCYSYQNPVRISPPGTNEYVYPITTTANPSKAVIADRNPFWDKSLIDAKTVGRLDLDTATPPKLKPDTIQWSNTAYHQREGQNVLYVDGHTKFEKTSNCSIDSDNIYTTWGGATVVVPTSNATGDKLKQGGAAAFLLKPATSIQSSLIIASSDNDSYLVSDYE